MENDALNRRRTMLPKWRAFGDSLEVFGKLTNKKIPGLKKLGWQVEKANLNRFKANPNPSIALELLQSSRLVDDEEVIDLTSNYLSRLHLTKAPKKKEKTALLRI